MNLGKAAAVTTAILATVVLASGVDANSRKAERIIEKHIKAMGGKKLRSIETVTVSGQVTMMGFDAPFTLRMKRPNHSRMDMIMMGRDVVQAFDGEKAWWINPFLGATSPTEMPADFAMQLLRWSELESPLVDYRRKHHRVRYLGEENTAQGSAHLIEVRLREGGTVDIFIDAATYLETRRSFDQSYRGKTRRVDTYFSDYEEVDGIMTPRTIRGIDLRGEPYVMSVDTWEFGAEIDDASFRKPKSPREESRLVPLRDFSGVLEKFNQQKDYVRAVAVLSPT